MYIWGCHPNLLSSLQDRPSHGGRLILCRPPRETQYQEKSDVLKQDKISRGSFGKRPTAHHSPRYGTQSSFQHAKSMTTDPQARNQGDAVPRRNWVMKGNLPDHRALSHTEKSQGQRKGNQKTPRADDETDAYSGALSQVWYGTLRGEKRVWGKLTKW